MNTLMAIVHAPRARSWRPRPSTHSPAAYPHVIAYNNQHTSRWAWLVSLFLIGVLLHSGNAHATDPGACAFLPGSSGYSQQTPLSGSFTVGRDLPVGAIIYTAIVTPSPKGNGNYFTCSAVGNYDIVRSYVSTPYPLASYTSPTYGKVYQTSVPGIGVAIVSLTTQTGLPATDYTYTQIASTSDPDNSTGTNSLDSYATHYMYLIKTGPVSPGTVAGSGLPITHVTVGTNALQGQLASFTGSINIVTGTCVTPDVTVNLGTHSLSELTGVGSTTDLVNVPIQLNNCPAFYGQSQTVLNGSALPVTPNAISFQVNPTTSVVDASQGVMALKPNGAYVAATGIGIQVLDASGVPIRYGTATPSGLALNQVDGASYTINLQARYYQAADTITAGIADGSATVTLIYN